MSAFNYVLLLGGAFYKSGATHDWNDRPPNVSLICKQVPLADAGSQTLEHLECQSFYSPFKLSTFVHECNMLKSAVTFNEIRLT